mmetsp:Transcript_45989/g.87760  ORF Transcript_45989/g.87760 Transcript_45989/m.87760 type:complete len:371 (-) Transcript_45989:303-1415(-)
MLGLVALLRHLPEMGSLQLLVAHVLRHTVLLLLAPRHLVPHLHLRRHLHILRASSLLLSLLDLGLLVPGAVDGVLLQPRHLPAARSLHLLLVLRLRRVLHGHALVLLPPPHQVILHLLHHQRPLVVLGLLLLLLAHLALEDELLLAARKLHDAFLLLRLALPLQSLDALQRLVRLLRLQGGALVLLQPLQLPLLEQLHRLKRLLLEQLPLLALRHALLHHAVLELLQLTQLSVALVERAPLLLLQLAQLRRLRHLQRAALLLVELVVLPLHNLRQLALVANLHLPLLNDVAEQQLAVERLDAVRLVIQHLVRALYLQPSVLSLDERLLPVNLTALSFFLVKPLIPQAFFAHACSLEGVGPFSRSLIAELL